MTHPRLSLVLDAPDVLPPEGRIALFRPLADTDLSDLPRERLHAIQGFRPDHDALAARGIATSARAEGPYAAAVVFVPRAKAEARALVAEAMASVVPGGPVWIDGLKTDGINSLLKELRARVPVSEPLAKAHGKIFRLTADPEALADWAGREQTPAEGFVTLPGTFSADAVDRGSALLAACLPETLPARVADLGAGWGWLSAQILAHPGVAQLHLVEADHSALECARANIADPRAVFHWADARNFQLREPVNGVIMNPPFHEGRAADPGLGAAFIKAAAGLLTGAGRLWMVANRHLPYEAELARHFADVTEIGGDNRFKILTATGAGARNRRMR